MEPQSPAAPNETDRSGSQYNNDLRSSHHSGSGSTQPQDWLEVCQVDSPVLFVENTTQGDQEVSIPEVQRSPQEQNGLSPATQKKPEATSDTQLPTSLGESESLAVADTPQITQPSSTARESIIREAQFGFAHQSIVAQTNAENEPETSSIELSVRDDIAQFPFRSQCPAFFDPRSIAEPTQRAVTEPPRTCDTHENSIARYCESPLPDSYPKGGPLGETDESTTIDEISQSPRDGPRFDGSASGSLENTFNGAEAVAVSQPLLFTEQLSGSGEENAQLVPSSAYLVTQEEISEKITEVNLPDSPRLKDSSPCSRHDSSQETPERGLQSTEESPSPIQEPPSYSQRGFDSNIPPRPATPLLSSSLSAMAEGTTETPSMQAARRLRELMTAGEKDRKRSRTSQSSVATLADATANNAASQSNNAASRSNNVLALPNVNISAEGTRSPSTVPDQSPALPPSTSLRTVPATTEATTSLRAIALYNANRVTEPLVVEPLDAEPKAIDRASPRKDDDLVTTAAAAAAQSLHVVPSSPAIQGDMENVDCIDDTNDISSINDYDYDDDEDPYDDELRLDDEEYIVPLYIEGRQRDTYIEYIKQKEQLLNEVLVHTPAPVEKLDEVDRALAHLKAVETHPDLTYAEAESATELQSRSLVDVRHGAQFGMDNSVKFRFLGQLFDRIRDKKLHVVLLLDQDVNALSNIIQTFLVARGYNFKMPTKGFQSTVSPDSLFITVFPKTATLVLPVVNLIICLDGMQSAAQARQRRVPASGRIIPVLHLVIPQTVGHIERYVLPTTERRTRIETILAGLARTQTLDEIGNAIDIDTPNAGQAAQMVASWLFPEGGEENTEWPLPSIGTARSIIELVATQQPVRSAASSPAADRTKRPLVSIYHEMTDSCGH